MIKAMENESVIEDLRARIDQCEMTIAQLFDAVANLENEYFASKTDVVDKIKEAFGQVINTMQ